MIGSSPVRTLRFSERTCLASLKASPAGAAEYSPLLLYQYVIPAPSQIPLYDKALFCDIVADVFSIGTTVKSLDLSVLLLIPLIVCFFGL